MHNCVSLDALGGHGIDRVVVAVGVFDGVHLGHQALLAELRRHAAELSAAAVVMTFHPHPRHVLFPDSEVVLLYSPDRKRELLAEYGIDAIVTIPFSRGFADLTAVDFIEECLCSSRVEVAAVCVGEDWRFGSAGRGDADFLRRVGSTHGFGTVTVDDIMVDGERVSSTAIRRLIAGGMIEKAAAMLGRRYSLRGRVGQGHHLAGPELGAPTANLLLTDGVLPPNGVYAARCVIDGRIYAVALAIGVSPTIQGNRLKSPRVEAHVLGFDGDLYDSLMEVELISHIREERCFPDQAALAAQIKRDLMVAAGRSQS